MQNCRHNIPGKPLKVESWHKVGLRTWVHDNLAVLSIGYSSPAPLRCDIIGQAPQAERWWPLGSADYFGWVVRLRYCDESWSYAINCPATSAGAAEVFTVAALAGVPVGEPTRRHVLATVRAIRSTS